jgi:cell division protein ZapA (FtsZ GTPase activity inhibitor)
MKIEGLALSVVHELQNLGHYIEEGEHAIEEKIEEWKDHVYHYPEQLKQNIEAVRELMK